MKAGGDRTIALISRSDSATAWAKALSDLDLPMALEVWPAIADPARVAYAVVAKPPPGILKTFTNLKAILSLWAGVDHVTRDTDWPSQVPLVRMIEDGMTAGMREFVLAQVLSAHLQLPDFARQQRDGIWRNDLRGDIGSEPLTIDRTVGVLGLGVLGSACAEALRQVGFTVMAWSRAPKSRAGIDCRHGPDGLDAIMAGSEILVNLLPATPKTENLMNARTIARMTRGAWIVNVARGEFVDDNALLAALDSGHLGGAILDAFRVEPLPADDPFWTHPKVHITPHVASTTRVRTGAPTVRANILALEAGEPIDGVYDPVLGY